MSLAPSAQPTRAGLQARGALAWLAIAGLAWFAAAIVLLHALRPDVDIVARVTSEYAVGRFGVLMTSAYLAMATALLALGVGLRRALGTRSAGIVFLYLAALGVTVAAFFPIDVGAPTPVTSTGRIHRLAAIVGFLSMTLAPLLLGRRFRADARWRDLAVPAWLAGGLGLLGFAAIQLLLLERGLAGAAQRAILVLVVAWMLAVALRLIAPGRARRDEA